MRQCMEQVRLTHDFYLISVARIKVPVKRCMRCTKQLMSWNPVLNTMVNSMVISTTRDLPQGGGIVQLGVRQTIHTSGENSSTDARAHDGFAIHHPGVAHGLVSYTPMCACYQ